MNTDLRSEFRLQAVERGCPQPQRSRTPNVLHVGTPALLQNRVNAELQTFET